MMKIHFRIHPAGAAVFAAAFLLMDSHKVLAYTAAMLAHELGHIAAMFLCRMKECFIEFTPFGGMADVPSFDMYSPIKKAAAAASGVLVSAGLALCVHQMQTTNLFLNAFYQTNYSRRHQKWSSAIKRTHPLPPRAKWLLAHRTRKSVLS